MNDFLIFSKFSCVDERDLFQSLQEEVNKADGNIFQGESTIDKIFSSWTQQKGVPLVSIKRNYDTGEISIRQSFNNTDALWFIPVSFATRSNPDFTRTSADYIMPAVREVTIKLSDLNIILEKDDWLLVNKQRTGLYHTTYDFENWLKIARALNENATCIHPINRALLFRTIDSVIEKDDYNISAFLELFNYLRNEKDYIVWDSAVDAIHRFRTDLLGGHCYGKFKSFVKDVISDILMESLRKDINSLTSPEASGLERVLELACIVDVQACIHHAEKEARQYIYENKTLGNYLLTDIILCQGMRRINVADFKEILNILKTMEDNPIKRSDIIYSFVCIESEDVMKVFLNWMIGESSSGIMKQELIDDFPFRIFIHNYFARSLVLDFLKENFSSLIASNKLFMGGLKRVSCYMAEIDGHKEKVSSMLPLLQILIHISFQFLHLINLIKSYQGNNSSTDFNFTEALSDVGHNTKNRERFIKRYDMKISNWLEENSGKDSVDSASNLRRYGRSTATFLAPKSYMFSFLGILLYSCLQL